MANYQLTQSGSQVQTLLDKIGTTALNTTATNLSSAINELKTDTDKVGNLNELYVQDPGTTDLVGAINAVALLTPTVSASPNDFNVTIGFGDYQIAFGRITMNTTANTEVSQTVSFNQSFSAVPVCFAEPIVNGTNKASTKIATNRSTNSSLIIDMTYPYTGSPYVGWVAFGKATGATP